MPFVDKHYSTDPEKHFSSINPFYFNWIIRSGYYFGDNAMARCVEACEAMQKDFSELTIKKGVVYSETNPDNYSPIHFKEYPHAWLEDQRGNLVDPTISQFELIGVARYREAVGEGPFLKCMGCGKYFDSQQAGNGCFCGCKFSDQD